MEYVGAQPERGWCYYFERADLARQQGDWALAAALGDQALSVPHLPVDYSEGLLLVEAYARVGRWDQALALAAWSLERAPALEPAVCDVASQITGESKH